MAYGFVFHVAGGSKNGKPLSQGFILHNDYSVLMQD